MTKTYYVTRVAGQVKRLDDLTLPWIDVSTGHTDGFLDVMAFPDEVEKVIVVGRNRGIYQSIDSGNTWTQAVGDYTSLAVGQQFIEVWIVNATVSYIAGGIGGIVLKSVDGGLTYNSITYPTGSGTYDGDANCSAIHFIDENIGIAGVSIGGDALIWKTIDGGSTWNVLNGGLSIGSPGAGGIHLSADEQNILVQTTDGAYRSTDAGVSFTQVLDLTVDFPTGSGSHLTWVDETTFWISGAGGTLRQSTDGGVTWNIIRPWNPLEGSILGAHFYDAFNGFLGQDQEIHSTTDAGTTTTLSEANVAPNAIWSEVFLSQVDPCYVLTDCAGVADPIYTGTDLSGHVDQVITLADENNSEIEGCWFVSINPTPCDDNDVQEVSVYKCYDDCDSCLPEPEPIRTPRPREVVPEFTTGLCDPQIVEKAFCDFGQLMYKNMMSERYKIAKCCPKDEDKILMQFHKIHLLLLESQDPTPDECNPLCVAYGIDIQIDDTAVITYTDCDGVEQTLNIDQSASVQSISFCGLNTTPPIAVITHPDTSTDTYTLTSLEVCENPNPTHQYRITIQGGYNGIGQFFTYIDEFGQTRQIDLALNKSDVTYNVCAKHGSLLFNGTDQLFIANDIPECGSCSSINEITIEYIGDC